MYEVTDAYKAAMKQPVQRFRMTGTIGKYKFNDDNILSGSFHLTNQCSDDTNISIGSVYIGELKVTLTGIPFVRGTLDDLEIQPVLGLMIADGSFEDIPLGVFHVSAADWGTSGVVITAYDNMARFDKNAAVTEMGTSTLFHFLEAACRSCGVAMGMTDLEVEALPNGTEQLSFYSENDIETWRDVVSWCAQTAGCFATMDRQGRLILKPYSEIPVDTIDMEHRFAGGKFSDFVTRYTGASVVNIADKTTSYYGVIPDDGLTMNLGQNPLLQYGVQEVLERQRRAVLNSVQAIQYVPMEISMIGTPAYDLGDVLSFTGGIAGEEAKSCITKFDWTYSGAYKVTCVGQDPVLSSAKSKTDKDIAGLISNVSDDSMRYYDYQNADGYEIGDGKKAKVIEVKYATVKATHVDFHAEILFNLETTELDDGHYTDTDGIITVTYYLNGEEVKDYYPVETLQDGRHMLHLLYTWKSTANIIGDFAVYLSMSEAAISIEPGYVRAYIAGQGLAGDGAWDGTVSVEDDVPLQEITTVLREYSDEVSLTFAERNDGGFSDQVVSTPLSFILQPIRATFGNVKMLHRFDTNHDSRMTYDHDQIEIADGAWKLKEGVTSAEMVTTDEEASEILSVTTHCDSNNVNFLASFDHGATWWTYENGWTKPDTSKDVYGMFGPLMGVITKEEWAEKLSGSIQFKIIIHDTGTLTDLQIYLKEVSE